MSQQCIDLEDKYGAHNYHSLPIVFSRAKGTRVWDADDRQYIDCLAAYSAVNQGHCHPRIISAAIEQLERLTISSRAFHSDQLGPYAKYITELFGYDMVLPMNTGVEAVETSMKLARKWAYKVKKVADGQAIILACTGNFHGRTIAVISMSSDPEAREGFGPFLPGVGPICPETEIVIDYNNLDALRKALEQHGHRVAAFLVEPIQGEAGVIVPDDGYLRKCHDLCRENNVLFIADEVQTGLGRTGKLLACEHDSIRPDIVILGKALSGGVYPVSAVLADRHVMLCIGPGEHGSTFGGNPVACAVATASLKVLLDEGLIENSLRMGKLFRDGLLEIQKRYPVVITVRGRGLMNAIAIGEGMSAWKLCLKFIENGLLAKPTHESIIRLTPPLCITEAEVKECLHIIEKSLVEFQTIP